MTHIQDSIRTVVERMRTVVDGPPYFLYGKRTYVNWVLANMNNSKVEKYRKYPLIALRFDNEDEIQEIQTHNLNIVIAGLSKHEYLVDERYSNVIKPILDPLYLSFMKNLRDCGLFTWPYTGNTNGWPSHVRVDRPYWGSNGLEENEVNVFTDPLDAIEIKNLEINSINNC